MSTTLISETIVYTNPASAITSWNIAQSNPSGLGTSQCVTATSPAGVAINTNLTFSIQAPRPAPLWYFSTVNAADSLTIFTTGNIPITLTTITGTTGFNWGYFQPNPGQKFNIIYKAGAIVAAAAVCFTIQAVVENTLSQYIDLGSVKFEHEDKCVIKPSMRLITTGNTTTAIPNTIAIDFKDYPIPETQNALCTFFGLLNAQGVLSKGNYGMMASGQATQQYFIVGGQMGSITMPGGTGMVYTGTIFLLISNIGTVSLPYTTFSIGMPTAFDVTEFQVGVESNQTQSVMTQLETIMEYLELEKKNGGHHVKSTIELSRESPDDGDNYGLLLRHVQGLDVGPTYANTQVISKMANDIRNSVKMLSETNQAAHDRLNEKIDGIAALLGSLVPVGGMGQNE